jgi:hypothetical protein
LTDPEFIGGLPEKLMILVNGLKGANGDAQTDRPHGLKYRICPKRQVA